MSNDLAAITSFPSSPSKTSLSKYKTPRKFLKRVQLCGSDKFVKKGLIPPGHYGIPGIGDDEDPIEDIGNTIDLIPVAMRDKALDWSGEQVVVCYDKDSDVFKDIERRASIKDSKCMSGPSFLVYVRGVDQPLEFFCNNKSSQQESDKFGEFLPVSEEEGLEHGVDPRGPQTMTLRSRFVDPQETDFSWWVPVVGKCSTPFKDLPPAEDMIAEANKFLNPPVKDVEVEKEDGRDR